MKERPILFSAPMVGALLDGRKTQTRRYLTSDTNMTCDELAARCGCPYGMPGDRLWVRERLALNPSTDAWEYVADAREILMSGDDPRCLAMIVWAHHQVRDYCPSIHMPRWASRITLEVLGVRVERLQSISEKDATAEGVTLPTSNVVCACEGPADDPGPHRNDCRWRDPDVDPDELGPHRTEFAILWNRLNGKRARWSANPWVWVVAFKRLP